MADLIDRDMTIYELEAFKESCIANLLRMSFEDITDVVKDIPAVNRWISVEDALPVIEEFNISDTVLCYCDSGALSIARLEANGFGQVGFNCEKDDEYHHSAGKVLYWMPLPEIPEPPKEDEA